MEISKITEGMRGIEVIGMVTDISPSRSVNLKTGDATEVADATLMDESGGSIKLSLWGADIERVAKGVKVKLSNAFTTTFKGQLQLSTGRYGKLEVIT